MIKQPSSEGMTFTTMLRRTAERRSVNPRRVRRDRRATLITLSSGVFVVTTAAVYSSHIGWLILVTAVVYGLFTACVAAQEAVVTVWTWGYIEGRKTPPVHGEGGS